MPDSVLSPLNLVREVECIDNVLLRGKLEVVGRDPFVGACRFDLICVVLVHQQRVDITLSLIVYWPFNFSIRIDWQWGLLVVEI